MLGLDHLCMFCWNGQVRGGENQCDRPSAATNLVKQAGSVHKIKQTCSQAAGSFSWGGQPFLGKNDEMETAPPFFPRSFCFYGFFQWEPLSILLFLVSEICLKIYDLLL